MWDAAPLRIAHFPTADEQVECQIVRPAGQQPPIVVEQRSHGCQG
jgi:hypothetical protein